MEKILLVLDIENIDIPAVEFACYIAALSRSKLTGVLIGDKQGAIHSGQPVYASGQATGVSVYEPLLDENTRVFEKLCANRCIRAELQYLSSGQAVKDLVAESRFADLIIAKAGFATEILVNLECPVLIAPPTFNGIDEVVFAYDGSRSSVFAIKQFTYLFPRLTDKRAMLLEVTDHEMGELTEKERIKALLKAHYSGIGHHMLHGKATDELFAYLLPKKTSMVVMGAYGRKLLQHSTASQLLKTIDCPFFIAHC